MQIFWGIFFCLKFVYSLTCIRGHSQTTWTRFWTFFSPPSPFVNRHEHFDDPPKKLHEHSMTPPLLAFFHIIFFFASFKNVPAKSFFKVWMPKFVLGVNIFFLQVATFPQIWKITLKKATWTFAKPPLPSLWTNVNIFETPPLPQPCSRSLWTPPNKNMQMQHITT